MLVEIKKWVLTRSFLLLGLLFSVNVWAIEPDPLEFDPANSAAEEQRLWDELLKYKLWGRDFLDFAGQNVQLTERAGYTGTMGDFTMANTNHTVYGVVVVGGDIRNADGQDVFDSGYVRIGTDLDAHSNSHGSTYFRDYTCIHGSNNLPVSQFTYTPDVGDANCPAGFPELETDLDLPSLSTPYGSATESANGGTLVIDGRITDGSNVKDIYYDRITLRNNADLLVRQDAAGGLTRIFVKTLDLDGTGWNIGVSHDGTSMIDIDDYRGTLLIYTESLSISAGNRTLMGSYISKGAINVRQGMTLAGQMIGASVTVDAGFDAANFNYVPFDPPEIDPTALASGVLAEAGTNPQKINISLTKPAVVEVTFNYYFLTPGGAGEATGADFSSIPQNSEANAGTVSIAKDALTPATDVTLDVFDDTSLEGDESFYIVIFNLEGAVLPGNVSRDTIELTLTDNDNNNPPTGDDELFTVNEDEVLDIVSGDFTYNDVAPGPTAFNSIELVSIPSKGTLFMDANGNDTPDAGETVSAGDEILVVDMGELKFLPALNENGDDYTSFDFQVSDGDMNSPTYTATINVTPINDEPSFTKGSNVSRIEDFGPVSINNWATAISDGDPELTQTLTFEITNNTNPGLFSTGPAINSAGRLTFTSANNTFGTATISIRLRDNGSNTSPNDRYSPVQTFTITISSVNDLPSINGPFNVSVREGAPLDSLLATLVGTDADVGTDPGESLSFEIVSGNTDNDFALDAGTGEFTVAKELDFETTPSYTVNVRVVDADGASDATTITITVLNENDNSPVAVAESYSVDEGGTITEPAAGVLSNDSDADGDVLTAVLVSGVSYGILGLNADGSFTYTHDDSENFSDSFRYRANDGANNSNTVTVTITINPQNDNSPVLVNLDTVDVSEDVALGTLIETVVATDDDIGDTPVYAIVSGNAEGKFAIDANSGEITVVDDLDFETTPLYNLGVQAFSGGDTATDTLVVRVLNVNDNTPVISDAEFTIPESTAVSTVIGTMTASDADGDALIWSISANPNVTVNNSGAVSIVSQYDFEAGEVYSYTVTVDDGTYTASATLTVNITNVNDNNPVALGETYTVEEGATLTINVPGLLANDTDADGDALSVVPGVDVNHGVLMLNADGSFSYTHDDSENFADSFTYRVTDGSRNSNLVTVTIDITPLNDNSPILDTLGSVNVSEGAPVATPIDTAIASDADGDVITYAIVGGNSEGKFTIEENTGVIALADMLDYETTASYTLTIAATAGGETVSDDLTVLVLNENDNAPVLEDTTFTITEITDVGTLIGTILASDADGNPLTWSVSANSKIEILSTGGVRTLELFDYESDSVYTYTVTVYDGVYTVNATLTILVTDVDEIPQIAIGPYWVDENSPAGTLIDSIILVNGVITGTVDFLKVADTTGAEDDGDLFTIDAVTGEIFVASGASLDYESDSLLIIWAVGTNIHGTSVAQEIHIGLRNVNETPVIAAQDFDLQENSPVGTVIGQVVSSDPENNQTYSLLPGSDARIVISSDGELSLGSGAVDFETETEISVGVIVNDGEFADTAVVTISILDENEAPVITSNELPVQENSIGGTEVGTLTATDPESQPLTWTVIDNDFVEITPDGLVTVKDGAELDYESGTNPVFQAIVSDGVNADTATITLIVGNENEPPIVVTDTLTVPENSEEGTVVGQVEAVDPDSGDVLTYEIVNETPFEISSTGEITVGENPVLDYENTPEIEVVVKVTDSEGVEVTDTIIVSLENSVEVSKVEIVTVTSEDTTWTRPDTIRTNAEELEITWEKDGNPTTDTEILEGDGEILVIRTWKDPTADLIGADTVVVLVNRENPTIRYPFEEPEIPEDRYLIVEKSPGSSDMLPDTADGQLVWPEPILPDTIGGIQVIFVHSEDTVLSALASYIDENLNEAETVIEIQPSLREFADGKPVLNVVTFEYTDPYGNVVQETLYVVLDKTPPVVEIINPEDSSETKTYVIDVDWTVDGRPMQYLLQESLQEGENFVIRSYMDRAGNIGSDTVFITLIPRQRYVLVSMEEPLVSMNQRRIDELYSLNPPEEGERFALSVFNVTESREEELQFGHGSAVREANGDEPYPGQRGAHLGPTLRMEIKVPHIGGYDAAGEPRGGDIRSLVGSDGMVVVPSLSGSSSADEFDTIPVADYVRLHCDEDAFEGLTSQELLDAGLMNTEILVSLNVYDFIGQFVDRITLRQEVSNVAHISDGGLVTFYLELKPDEKGMIRNQSGRSFGTGAYILNGYVRSVSTGLCNTPDMSRGERQDRKENVSTKFGYRRD